MSLILAIEPDRRQASKVTTLAQTLGVELIVGASTEEALVALGTRVPDLVLTSQLLAPKDESALSERLRALDAAGMHAPTLVIPVLGGEEREQKKKGGLFGRLRKTGQDRAAGESDGCDPAVFGQEVMDYLERGAAERAALAIAQADLEAAWADAASSAAAQVEPAGQPSPTIDVDAEMVTADQDASFGEFAAIPLWRADAIPLARSLAESTIEMASGSEQAMDDELPPATPPWTPPPPTPADEEWEEIALDVDGKRGQRPESSTTEAADTLDIGVGHHVDLASESMDLDAFVRELHTVASTAHAEPMIPVVDLTHVSHRPPATDSSQPGDVDALLPEPVAVTEVELREEARATFEAEVAAAFAKEAEPAFTSGLELVEPTPSEFGADPSEPPAPVAMPEEQMPSAAAITLTPDYLDAALAAFNPEIEAAQLSRARTWEPPAESWRAELDALPPPPAPTFQTGSAIEQVAQPQTPALGAKWGDVLSAIRRDVDQRRSAEEVHPAIAKSKADVVAPPLVFPTRTVAPSVIAAIESGAAERLRPEPPVVALQSAPDVLQPDRALAALLETVSTAKALRPRPVVDETPTESPALAPSPESVAAPAEPIESPVETVVLDAEDRTEPAAPAADPLAWLAAATTATVSVESTPASTLAEVTVDAEEAAPKEPEAFAFAGAAAAASTQPAETPRPAVAAAPATSVGTAGQSRSKKKRRHQKSEAPPQVVRHPIGAWGFFDPQASGFGPLVARLNQLSTGVGASPRG